MRLITHIFSTLLIFSVLSAAKADEVVIAVKEEGFHADIVKSLCTKINPPCRTQIMEKPLSALRQTTVAAALVFLPGNPPIEKKGLSFSRRYYKEGARFVRRKGGPGGVSYKGMAGRIVGVQGDSIFDKFLVARFADANIRRYDDLPAARDDLINGKLDFILADRRKAWAHDDIEATGPVYTSAKYFGGAALAFHKKGGKALRKQFNAAIKALRKSGQYREIYDKHFADKQ